MAVIREYRCTAHDHEFESRDEAPPCPYGCHPKFVVREFRTPVSIGSRTSRVVDHLQRELASDYGLTDMSNDRDASVMSRTRQGSGGMRRIGSGSVNHEYRSEQVPAWAPSIFRPAPGWSKTGEVPAFNFNQSGLKGPGGVSRTQPQLDVAKGSLRRNTKVEARWKQ